MGNSVFLRPHTSRLKFFFSISVKSGGKSLNILFFTLRIWVSGLLESAGGALWTLGLGLVLCAAASPEIHH